MSEVAAAEAANEKESGAETAPQAHPVREWIDTLLKAAVIAKGKQKPNQQVAQEPQTAATPSSSQPATTAPVAMAGEAHQSSGNVRNAAGYSADSAVPVVETADAGEEASTGSVASPKRYRRRRCEVEGCTKFARFNNACSGHGGRRLCSESGCERVAQFGHKCSAHGGIRYCSVEGCHRAVQSRGCCKTHGGGVRCQHPDCDKGAISKGFCRSHGGGSRCAFEGCSKWAQRHGYCVRHCKGVLVNTVRAVRSKELLQGEATTVSSTALPPGQEDTSS